MASSNIPPNKASAITTSLMNPDLELENSDRDGIILNGSLPSTLDCTPSKAATATFRRSLEIENVEAAPRQPSFATQWERIEKKVPRPFVRCGRKIVDWVQGPKPPRAYMIVPILERWQTLPARLLARFPKLLRICIFSIVCIVWIVLFAVIISKDDLPSNFGGLGAPVRLGCVANLW